MNVPVIQQQTPQLPAYLQNHNHSGGVLADALGGLSAGAVHKISIEGKRWKLQDPQGQEFEVPHFHLDVIIVGVNRHVSKVFYATKWIHGQDQKAPDCWSDNGIGPSSRAAHPQCGTCQQCPNNAWGSRISETGSQVKACADSKKLAVILADNPTGAVYQLRVPADSLKNLATAAKTLSQQKPRPVDLEHVIMRLTFDPAVPHPKVVFSPLNYVSEQQYEIVEDLKGTEDVIEVTNMSDVVRGNALPAPAQPVPVPVPSPVPQQQHFTPPVQPQFMPPQQEQFVPQAPQAPQHFVPQTQVQFNPMAAPAPVAPPTIAPVAPAPRKRRTKAQMAAEAAEAGVGQIPTQPPVAQPVPVAPQMFTAPPGLPPELAPNPVAPNFQMAQPAGVNPAFPQPAAPAVVPTFLRTPDVAGAQPAAAAVPISPQPTDSALDNLLGKAMGR